VSDEDREACSSCCPGSQGPTSQPGARKGGEGTAGPADTWRPMRKRGPVMDNDDTTQDKGPRLEELRPLQSVGFRREERGGEGPRPAVGLQRKGGGRTREKGGGRRVI